VKFVHERTGRVLVPVSDRHARQLVSHRCWTLLEDGTPEPAPAPAAAPEPVPAGDDGVRHVGGPWYEVIVRGEQVAKVMGKNKAQERFETETSRW
jgi:hypothetical protein